jgi:YfiR/HmsC-like
MALLRAALPRAYGKALLALLAAAWLGVAFVPAVAQAQVVAPEYDVKAAFLFNFTKFVEWPFTVYTDEHSPLKLCVLGENPFGKALKVLMDEEVGGRKLAFTHLETATNLETCHVLFISRSERDRLPQILASLHNAPVLTVGEMPAFIDQGGMINFILEGSKVRFDVNQEAAERAGLKISSRLLALAKHVKGKP